jgi:hypothetical protein
MHGLAQEALDHARRIEMDKQMDEAHTRSLREFERQMRVQLSRAKARNPGENSQSTRDRGLGTPEGSQEPGPRLEPATIEAIADFAETGRSGEVRSVRQGGGLFVMGVMGPYLNDLDGHIEKIVSISFESNGRESSTAWKFWRRSGKWRRVG